MTYNEFPSIAVPEFLQGEPWEDYSYRNDVCPRSQMALIGGGCLTVWVAEDDLTQREYPDQGKFTLEHHVVEDDFEGTVLYQGDSVEEVRAAIAAFLVSRW